jgi:alkanesulfonate monooxygenase SsuD/methylene tetrahydromethanopterin reductase-like flavin-dependent oxidoreductase (luciferase family)
MITPWIFEFFTAFRGEQPASDFAWYLDQWAGAERLGFEGIFFSEHHFIPFNYGPSPNLLIAATAARTTRLRQGTMGNVLPMYEPWRLAEEYCMLDQLSNGRLEIGYSSGIGPDEYLAVGITTADARSRAAESMDIIDGLLTQPRISHAGKHWQLPDFGVAPRPKQQPAPPRWLSGMSDSSATNAARRGYRFCTGFMGLDEVRATLGVFQHAARAAGRAASVANTGLRRMVYIDNDRAAAQAKGVVALAAMRAIMSGGEPGAVADAPQESPGDSMIADAEVIAGDVASVSTAIIEQCRHSGAGHFLAYAPNTLNRGEAASSRRLWAEVIPRLRAATLEVPGP